MVWCVTGGKCSFFIILGVLLSLLKKVLRQKLMAPVAEVDLDQTVRLQKEHVLVFQGGMQRCVCVCAAFYHSFFFFFQTRWMGSLTMMTGIDPGCGLIEKRKDRASPTDCVCK